VFKQKKKDGQDAMAKEVELYFQAGMQI